MDSLALVGVMKLVGGILGVWEAHEILRGIKTLAVRMDRQCTNAQKLAERLRQDEQVGRVYYPSPGDESSSALS
jgi:cystathionine beta-lyase/cystathionine gamma-synthase